MYKVLIVDDEPIVKVAFRAMIEWEELGFSIVATASNGKEALDKIESYVPDIVITDLKMPGMDGIELIDELKNKNYQGKIIVVSNYGEYELVREALTHGAMDYILKITMSRDELIKQLKKAVELLERENTQQNKIINEKINEHTLQKARKALIREFLEDKKFNEDILTDMKEMNIEMLSASYLYYINFLDIMNHLEQQACREKRYTFINIIENVIRELFEEIDELEIIQLTETNIMIIISKNELKIKNFSKQAFANRLYHTLRNYLSMPIKIIYSNSILNYEEARLYYIDCKEVMNITFYQDLEVACIEEIKFKELSNLSTYMLIANQIMELYILNSYREIEDTWEHFIEEMKQKYVSPSLLKDFCSNLVQYLYISTKQEMTLDIEVIKEHIVNSRNIEELGEGVKNFLKQLYQSGNYIKVMERYRKEVRDVIYYIEGHYDEKLSLQQIARQVNLNESYLCRIFKEQVGKSIGNYITEIKMKKAAQMMQDSSIYIKEISRAIGIDNQFYFNKLFKKHFGITPTEYKEKIK